MRTTVQITDRQRARLLQLAMSRGERGISGLVREAIEQYLRGQVRRRARVSAALSVLGTLSTREARSLTEAVRGLREGWRGRRRSCGP